MSEDDKRFVEKLVENCRDHKQWLTVIKFGMTNLLKDQDFLMSLILREAENEAKCSSQANPYPAAVVDILAELGLHLTTT